MRNGVETLCEVKKLRWGSVAVEEFLMGESIDIDKSTESIAPGFDTVFGSDIIYDENKLDILFATVSRLLANAVGTGVFVVAYRRRSVSIDIILDAANAAGFDVVDVNLLGELFLFTKRKEGDPIGEKEK